MVRDVKVMSIGGVYGCEYLVTHMWNNIPITNYLKDKHCMTQWVRYLTFNIKYDTRTSEGLNPKLVKRKGGPMRNTH